MGGGGGGSAPKQPKFKPTDAKAVGAAAKEADIQGYQLSDADYAKRFPLLVEGRDNNIASALANLSGQQDPQMAQALGRAGLSRDIGDTEFEKARSLGQPILDLQKRDRDYFQRLLGDNPQRTAGLSGKNIGEIAASNATGMNAYAQAGYGSNINMYNQQIAQNAANTSAGIGAIGSLFSAGIGAYNKPPANSTGYLSNYSYGTPTTPMGYQGGPAWGASPYGG